MVSTWIEAPAKGRQGGPVRAGMWSTVVIGTHPIETDQEVWLELSNNETDLGSMPAYWIENKGVNSLWHVPVPPMGVNTRIRYRAGARKYGAETVYSAYQEMVVRANLPSRSEGPMAAMGGPEGLVGNRHMSIRVDERGATYDIYFPTVGLHSDVRPAHGDLPQSRSHFRAILGGLALGHRLDWFSERTRWEVLQRYQSTTSNILVTELISRSAPVRVIVTDFAGMGPTLPGTAGGGRSPGQYFKRFRITNESDQPLRSTFGLFVQAEVNGGVGEPLLSWLDGERALLASNRGHGHVNRKLARDATVEFGLALDDRGPIHCEAVASNEAMLLRAIEVPAGGSVSVDLMVSGAFTGWKGDVGTFDHWIRPALDWFRRVDLDTVEREASRSWEEFSGPVPLLRFPRNNYAQAVKRSALAAALHADQDWGAIASGYDRGLNAYCWPRDAIFAGLAFARSGHPEIARKVFEWLSRVRSKYRSFQYWFQKYTIDGWPEWETPSIDQTALVPWALERYYRLTGELGFVAECWPLVEQAAAVCCGHSGHPGMRLLDDLNLATSAAIWDNRYGAYLYGNAAVVAGLRAAVRLGEALDQSERLEEWSSLADRIWREGVLPSVEAGGKGPGLVDAESGRFLEGRRLTLRPGLWTARPELMVESSAALDITLLGPVVPFGLLGADDPRARATAEALLRYNGLPKDPNALVRWTQDPMLQTSRPAPMTALPSEPSSLATLWMARYLLELGRATGEGAVWTRALALIDDILARLGPLGLAMRVAGRRGDDANARSTVVPGVWGLHAQLIEAMMDIAGLDYDVPARRITLRPVLPIAWQQVGLSRSLKCGEVTYRLDRTMSPGAFRLGIDLSLNWPVSLDIEVSCPGLQVLRGFEGAVASGPTFDASRRQLSWSVACPSGASRLEWTWS